MNDEKLLKQVTAEVLRLLEEKLGRKENPQRIPAGEAGLVGFTQSGDPGDESLMDLTAAETKKQIMLQGAQNPDALAQLKQRTPARIGLGKAGPRLGTRAQLTFRADHAVAMDAVFRDVNEAILDELQLFSFQTLCQSRNEHLTRPDKGRQFSPESIREMSARCSLNPQVQVYLSDGLSSQAVDANARDILPALLDGLKDYGISTGTPFFVKFGRVPAMDVVSETLGADVTCVLIGERPGLATADSMSAYIAYRGKVGMPEARRTVISNIHSGGIPAVEAGAHIAQVIKTILDRKVSGVELQL